MNFVGWLLDTSMGSPGPSGHWSPWLAVPFHASNLILGLAHLAIPLMVWAAWNGSRRDGVAGRDLFLAALFLPATALSRFTRVIELTGAPYRLTTIVDCAAAILTVFSAYRFWSLITHIVKLPTRAELHKTKDALQVEVSRGLNRELDLRLMNEALERKIAEAQVKIDRLEHDRASANWWKAQKTALTEIKDQFQAITRQT